jgi:hypothetical protein
MWKYEKLEGYINIIIIMFCFPNAIRWGVVRENLKVYLHVFWSTGLYNGLYLLKSTLGITLLAGLL